MKSPATTSVKTVVSQRATGELGGSLTSVAAYSAATNTMCPAAAARLKKQKVKSPTQIHQTE
jgi:hypothetical protein